VTALDDLAALVRVQQLLDAEVEQKALTALSEGEPRTEVARALGVSRSSLYRRFEAVTEF